MKLAPRGGRRALLALAAGAVLGAGAAGCGAGGRTVAAASAPAAKTAVKEFTYTTSAIPPGQRVRGDGDADNPGDLDGNGDHDHDRDNDQPVPESYRFPDEDDKASFAYGRRASPVDERAIASVVMHYYAAAARGDGATACALLEGNLARTIPRSYGGQLAPVYMRGAGTTCAAVLRRFLQHYRQELAAPVEIASVRVAGATALAVVSSRTLRASELYLARRGRSWQLTEVLGQTLP
jgi:hypothetical protein